MSKYFPIVVAKGKPYDCGLQHGNQAKKEIRNCIEVYKKLINKDRGIDWSQAKNESKKYLPYIEKYDKSIMEEIAGIADGAELELDDILTLNTCDEILEMNYCKDLSPQCTSFFVAPETTSSGHTFLGQNYDEYSLKLENRVILKVEQEGKPSIVTLTEAGIRGRIGFNSAGLGLCINSVYSSNHGRQINGAGDVVTREILNSSIMSEAIRSVQRMKHTLSVNYLISHREGEAIDLEVMPHDINYTYPDAGIYVHANHFNVDRNDVKDSGKLFIPHSLVRRMRMKNLLEQERGKIDVEMLQKILKDHFDYPVSICRHPDPQWRNFMTVASVIMDLTDMSLYLSKGPPCQNDFECLSFNNL